MGKVVTEKSSFFKTRFSDGGSDSRTEVRFGGTRGSDWGDNGGSDWGDKGVRLGGQGGRGHIGGTRGRGHIGGDKGGGSHWGDKGGSHNKESLMMDTC